MAPVIVIEARRLALAPLVPIGAQQSNTLYDFAPDGEEVEDELVECFSLPPPPTVHLIWPDMRKYK